MRFAALMLFVTSLLLGVAGCAGTPHVVVPVDSALRPWAPDPADAPPPAEDTTPPPEATKGENK